MSSASQSAIPFAPLIYMITLLASSYLINQAQSASVDDKFQCPHGWTRYGSKKCLKYVNELQDYERAQLACRSKNQGSLVTIHSQEEQNFVYSYIHSIAASSTPIWLGAKQIDFESILWLDKTENSFTNWAPSEPSHPDEICIAINPRNGHWHDVMCGEANVPACERAPTTQWPFFVPFCSEGWFQYNDEKCIRIISSQALNFYESQELCRSKYNSKLLSIKSEKESEFLHNLIKFKEIKVPVWLGAVQNDLSSFNWIDKSDVTFTNWADSEPNDPDHGCISMVSLNGKWSDNDCKEQKLILCQKTVSEDGACEPSWLQFRQDKCYRFVHVRLAFDDAESLCNSLYGGHLPSIHSQEEQYMLTQFLASINIKNSSEIWLGGRQMDFHNFNWADGSQFNYSFWEPGEPNFPAEKCIEMSWRNGRWNDINCKLKRAVLCERQLPIGNRHNQMNKPILYQPGTCLLDLNCSSIQASGTGSTMMATAFFAVTSPSNQTNSSLPTNQFLNNIGDIGSESPQLEPMEDSPANLKTYGVPVVSNNNGQLQTLITNCTKKQFELETTTSKTGAEPREPQSAIDARQPVATSTEMPSDNQSMADLSGVDPIIKITDLATESILTARVDKPSTTISTGTTPTYTPSSTGTSTTTTTSLLLSSTLEPTSAITKPNIVGSHTDAVETKTK